jgi:hypothetical protein
MSTENNISWILSHQNDRDMSSSFGKVWSDSYTEVDFNGLIYNFPLGYISEPYKNLIRPNDCRFFWFSKKLCIGGQTKRIKYSLKRDVSYFLSVKEPRGLKELVPSNWENLSSCNLYTLRILIGDLNNMPQFINHPIEIFRHVALWRLRIGK